MHSILTREETLMCALPVLHRWADKSGRYVILFLLLNHWTTLHSLRAQHSQRLPTRIHRACVQFVVDAKAHCQTDTELRGLDSIINNGGVMDFSVIEGVEGFFKGGLGWSVRRR